MFRRLLGNASTNLLQLFVNMTVTFIMAPIYLRLMGHYDYGLREIVFSLLGYMGLLSLGMQPTISRFISASHAVKDRESVREIYATGLSFMCLVGVAISLMVLAGAYLFADSMGQTNGDGSKYQLFLFLVAVQVLFSFPMNVTQSFLEGIQRFVFKNVVNMGCTIFIAVVCFNYMTEDNGLVLLASLTAATVVLRLLIYTAVLAMPEIGHGLPDFRRFSWSRLKEMLVFGSKAFVQGLSTKANKSADQLVIGGILGPAMVPVLTIPRTLIDYVNRITMTFTQVFMPVFSDMAAKDQGGRLKDLYLVSSKYTVAVVMAMSIGASVIGQPFIELWMPGQFDPATVNSIVFIMGAYMVIHRLNPFAGHFLTAINKHGFLAKVSPIGATVNVIASIILVYKIGVVGAALGTLIPVFVLSPLVLAFTCKHLGVSFGTYVRQSILPGLIPVLFMTAVVVWLRLSWGLDSYTRLLICVLAGGLTFVLTFFLFSCPPTERNKLLKHLGWNASKPHG